MISIKDKIDCCGCSACVQTCPKQCIRLEEDNEGFLYPSVNKSLCVECGQCDNVCPMLHGHEPQEPVGVYAATNPDEGIRMQSSSGGIFSLIAENIIRQGGVVFGAAFNEDWEVTHCFAETVDGIARFRGSKYVQSRTGTTYAEAERFLKAGRKVLYSGTPCQIAGLKSFLRKEYGNLLTVDCVCHGVPSPGVFREYLKREKGITLINFRDKISGWKCLSLTLETATGRRSEVSRQNEYMQGFLNNIYLRPTCHHCRFREGRSTSDITLGDFWGIDQIRPELDDDKGISIVITNAPHADNLLKTLRGTLSEMLLEDAMEHNPSIRTSVSVPSLRRVFFALWKRIGFKAALKICTDSSIPYRAFRKIIRTFVR